MAEHFNFLHPAKENQTNKMKFKILTIYAMFHLLYSKLPYLAHDLLKDQLLTLMNPHWWRQQRIKYINTNKI